jgi:hypothetical protein
MEPAKKHESIAAVRLDLITAKILAWVATRRDYELTPEAHLFFFDRYQLIAEHHRRRGRMTRARALQRKADEHYRLGGGDGPPYAAAMGMPRPRRWAVTDAVSRYDLKGPPDAA